MDKDEYIRKLEDAILYIYPSKNKAQIAEELGSNFQGFLIARLRDYIIMGRELKQWDSPFKQR